MKITRLKIGKAHQFRDFEVFFTYPKEHEKEGQPLEKVCFIGQSGTGKTTLLNVISTVIGSRSSFEGLATKLSRSELATIEGDTELFELKGTYFWDNGNINVKNSRYKKISIDLKKHADLWTNEINKIKNVIINFPADLLVNFDNLEDPQADISAATKKTVDFSIDKASSVWKLILSDIQKYQEDELRLRQEISKAVENAKTDLQAIQVEVKKLENWKAKTFNPIKDLARKCLNPLLQHFKLRVKTELDFQKKEDIGFIKIEDLHGNEIPNGLLSTGTKQIILSALPLYLLEPDHTVVLFDEPERSLFPDIQRILIDFYSGFTSNSQFFYATHSPIIASSFEPFERFILYFDEEGYVQWKQGVAPIGDDPNDLLKKDFGMQSLMNDKGISEYKRYLDLKAKAKQEKDEEKKGKLVLELTKLAEEYNF